jgi:phosphate transport system permease protein
MAVLIKGAPEESLPSSESLPVALFDLRIKRHQRLDIFFRETTRIFAISVLLLLIAILAALFVGAWPALKEFGFSFITSSTWDPVASKFGALVPIYGTVVTSIIALVIAVPVSFGIALFLTELSPPILKVPLGIAIELLAAIPSIIYGMWGLFIFAPFFARDIEPWMIQHLGSIPIIGALFQGVPMGIGMLTSGFILAIMIIPFISAVTRDVFELVPPMLKESAYGLGATTWEVVRSVVLPHSRSGVIAGIMLGLGRALGETMAVTFVIGNSHDLSASLLMPGNTISSSLANEFTEAVGELYTSSLIALGLLLFVITFIVLACAKLLLLRLQKQEGVHS